MEVRVQDADGAAFAGQVHRQGCGQGGFPHSTFSAGYGQDFFHLREVVLEAALLILDLSQNVGASVSQDVLVAFHKVILPF